MKQLTCEANKPDFVKQSNRGAFLLKSIISKCWLDLLWLKKQLKPYMFQKPEESTCAYWVGAMASHTHLFPRIHFPGDWFDQKQLPPTVCTSGSSRRAAAGFSVTHGRAAVLASACRYLNTCRALQTTLTKRRAKAPCLHKGNPTLPCGKLHLEYPNVPEVMKHGFEQRSAWLSAYESSTRRFGNLLMLHSTNTFWMITLHSYAVCVGWTTCTLPTVRLVCVFP